MQLPLLPLHARSLGASPVMIGLVGSLYGVLQLVCGPVAGRLSDLAGCRRVILLCFLMSSIGYTFTVFSKSAVILIFSRILLGIFKHGIAVIRALMAEVTPKKERPLVFGRFNAIASVGFIIGPLCGGYLSEYEGGFYHVAACTAIIYFLSLAFIYITVHPPVCTTEPPIPESLSAEFTGGGSAESKWNPAGFVSSFGQIVRSSGDLLSLRFLLGLSIMMYRNNFTLIMQEQFNATPVTIGWLISYGSLVGVVGGAAVGRVVAYYGNVWRLLLHCSLALAVSLTGLTFAPSLTVVVFFLTALSLTNPVLRVCITDLSIQRGKLDNAGALLGISQSVTSVSRTISPSVSGVMFELGPLFPGATGVVCAIAASLLMISTRERVNGKHTL